MALHKQEPQVSLNPDPHPHPQGAESEHLRKTGTGAPCQAGTPVLKGLTAKQKTEPGCLSQVSKCQQQQATCSDLP